MLPLTRVERDPTANWRRERCHGSRHWVYHRRIHWKNRLSYHDPLEGQNQNTTVHKSTNADSTTTINGYPQREFSRPLLNSA